MASSCLAASSLGARVGGTRGNPLRRRQQRAATRQARRHSAARAQAQNGNGDAWDTLSVDELQEWEVRGFAGAGARAGAGW